MGLKEKTANVASQDVYRLLSELQEKGLVEKIISKPTLYKATPPNEGLSILLQKKKEEYNEAKKQAKILSKDFHRNGNPTVLKENVEFIITSEMEQLLKLHNRLADMTKNSIDFVCAANEKILYEYCEKYIKRAIKRGVKVRVIAQKEKEETIVGSPNALLKKPLFGLRYLSETAIPFGMHIFDNQEVILAVSQDPIPSLWTNSPHVVKLAEIYFENFWSRSQMKYTIETG